MGLRVLAALLVLAAPSAPSGAPVILTEGTNIYADVSADGRIAMDLLGSIWVLPANGGQANIVTDNLLPAHRPRWSPQGDRILYQTESSQGIHLWMLDLGQGKAMRLWEQRFLNQHGSWHPDGERIVFSSGRGNSGLDLWEHDLPSGLSWRISNFEGDETEPAWSANGRHLAFLRHHNNQWVLMLRRFGERDRELVVSDELLSSPSWRPDGSLLTFLQQQGDVLTQQMVILSEPPLVRQIGADQDFFLSPVSWRDRHRFYYTADGHIKMQDFGDRRVTAVNFTASIGQPASRPARDVRSHALPITDPPGSKLIIRGARLFDGAWHTYRPAMDVIIDGSLITAVEPRREYADSQVLDLGDVTILPGFIDSYASIPPGDPARAGLQLLSYGVTTIISDERRSDFDPQLWESEGSPGPRLLLAADASINASADRAADLLFVTVPAGRVSGNGQREQIQYWQDRDVPVLVDSWRIGLSIGADLLLGAHTMPTSPLGRQYQDIQLALGSGPLTLVSGLADAGTPGLAQLFRSRQARLLGHSGTARRRYAVIPQFRSNAAQVVVGSKPSGLPAGLSLHAELRALAAAGLRRDQVLRAAGANAASVLGLDKQIGRIAAGSRADLVLVNGDPLRNIADALNVVAVVRNGRFYSAVSLLERLAAGNNVE